MRRRRKHSAIHISSQQEQLRIFRYINNQMSEEERYALELEMDENPFLQDAVEGLASLAPADIEQMTARIHKNLKKELEQKKKKQSLFFNHYSFIWVLILLLFIIIFISWWYISIFNK